MPPEHHPAAILLLAGSTEEGPAAHLLWRLRVGKEARAISSGSGAQAARSLLVRECRCGAEAAGEQARPPGVGGEAASPLVLLGRCVSGNRLNYSGGRSP